MIKGVEGIPERLCYWGDERDEAVKGEENWEDWPFPVDSGLLDKNCDNCSNSKHVHCHFDNKKLLSSNHHKLVAYAVVWGFSTSSTIDNLGRYYLRRHESGRRGTE